MNKYRSLYNTTLSLIINLLLVMGCFILCRVIFLIENLKAFSDLSAGRIWRMFEGGFLFDTSAILYTNLLYIFLMLIPLHYKENVIYQKITKGIFVTTNLIVIIMNLMDTVYFQYTHRRTTASVFSEFKNEGNLGGIIGTELLNHWYLTLNVCQFIIRFICLLWGLECTCVSAECVADLLAWCVQSQSATPISM